MTTIPRTKSLPKGFVLLTRAYNSAQGAAMSEHIRSMIATRQFTPSQLMIVDQDNGSYIACLRSAIKRGIDRLEAVKAPRKEGRVAV